MGNASTSSKQQDRRFDEYTQAFVYDRPYSWDPKEVIKTPPEQRKGVKKRLKKRAEAHPEEAKPIAMPSKTPKKPKSVVAKRHDQTPEEKLEKIPKSSELNERVEKAVARTAKLEKSMPKKKKRLDYQPPLMSGLQKRLLFCNPGDELIQMAHYALSQNTMLPKWAWAFRKVLSADQDTLYYKVRGKNVPFAWLYEKRKAIKAMYFDPKKPSTINPITDALREKYCNISRRNVTFILRSLETYQRNFGRRKPPKVLGRMNLTQPGILACDMFFPSKLLGWVKMNCLTVMDTWSRFGFTLFPERT